MNSSKKIDRPSILIGFAIAGLVAMTVGPSLLSTLRSHSESAQSNAQEGQTSTIGFKKVIRPILEIHCEKCHSSDDARGGFSLADFREESSIQEHRAIWERAGTLVLTGAMPPAGAPQPTVAEQEKVLDYFEATLSSKGKSAADSVEGVTFRRLNRLEYDNTVRDLLGVDFHSSDDFPSDDVGDGFDNNGEFLSFSPLLMEKYLSSAEKIAERAIAAGEDTAAAASGHRHPLVVCHPRDGRPPIDCVREDLRQFLHRAFRRPVADEELDVFVSLAAQALEGDESFFFAMQTALTAVLVSPHFLLRVESDRDSPDDASKPNLRGYELATRLSYFL